MTWKIPLFKNVLDDDDVNEVTAVLKSGMNWASGSQIESFEKMIADYMGRGTALPSIR